MATRPKALIAWSSGKDSAWALHLLNCQHPGAVAGLLTTVNEAVDRVAMHAVRRDVLEPTGSRREPGRTGGRPAEVYRFRSRRLEITDPFAALRPPA